MEANNNQLQEEVKQLKDEIETLTQKKLQLNTSKMWSIVNSVIDDIKWVIKTFL